MCFINDFAIPVDIITIISYHFRFWQPFQFFMFRYIFREREASE